MKVPKYRRYKETYAKVVFPGRREVHLGPYDAPESRAKYDRLVAEFLANERKSPPPIRLATQRRVNDIAGVPSVLTVADLAVKYYEFAQGYYQKNGRPTGELCWVKYAMRHLLQLFADIPVNEFGPKQLKLARDKMIEQGLARKTINQRTQKIVRCFKWGVSEEFVKPEILQALKSVDGLRAGRSAARESEKVRPAPIEHIEAIRPHMNPVPMAVVDLLLLTGARVGEITSMRTCDIDTSQDQWVFTPESHKTDYTGKRRYIPLGRKGMAIVSKFLKPDDPTAYLFQPREAMAIRKEALRMNRKSRVQPSQIDRSKPDARRKPGERYVAFSIRQCISRACEKAGIPAFHPHQIRHTAATEIRKKFGIELARATLGHSSAVTSEIYAELDLEKVRQVMMEVG